MSRHEPSLDLSRGGLGELVGDEDARGDLKGGDRGRENSERRKEEGRKGEKMKTGEKEKRRKKRGKPEP